MNKIALFPGSFDPFTKGHEVIVNQALSLFDEVIIAIGINNTKSPYFEIEKRKNHISSLFKDDSVRVVTYSCLTVELCKQLGSGHIIRGLRDSKDFSYEKSIAQMNEMMSGISTVFFLTDREYSAINSTIVREIHKNNGDISLFVTNSELLV